MIPTALLFLSINIGCTVIYCRTWMFLGQVFVFKLFWWCEKAWYLCVLINFLYFVFCLFFIDLYPVLYCYFTTLCNESCTETTLKHKLKLLSLCKSPANTAYTGYINNKKQSRKFYITVFKEIFFIESFMKAKFVIAAKSSCFQQKKYVLFAHK